MSPLQMDVPIKILVFGNAEDVPFISCANSYVVELLENNLDTLKSRYSLV